MPASASGQRAPAAAAACSPGRTSAKSSAIAPISSAAPARPSAVARARPDIAFISADLQWKQRWPSLAR